MKQVEYFLGIRFRVNETVIQLDKSRYISKLLDCYNLQNAHPTSTPMSPSIEFDDQTSMRNTSFPYRELIGSLLSLAQISRPDILFSVSKLSRYTQDPRTVHCNGAKNILRYLKKTKDLCITYEKSKELKVIGYTDSDYAGDKPSRKSTNGYVFLINGGSFTWKSTLQKCVASSTMEAEYIGQAWATREALYIRKLLDDFDVPIDEPLTIFADNEKAIDLAYQYRNTQRSKHIDVAYHITRDYASKNYIKLQYIPTKTMTADCLTKALDNITLSRHTKSMGLQDAQKEGKC